MTEFKSAFKNAIKDKPTIRPRHYPYAKNQWEKAEEIHVLDSGNTLIAIKFVNRITGDEQVYFVDWRYKAGISL